MGIYLIYEKRQAHHRRYSARYLYRCRKTKYEISMADPFLTVRRRPYEEPYNTQLEFTVSNGVFGGRVDIYCNVDDLADIGRGLKDFSGKIGDEYRYEYGSESPAKRFYRYFLLRAYARDSLGHCAIQFAMNLNEVEPDEGICKLSIPAELMAINRLGTLFESFGKLQHVELRWSLRGGRLYDSYQDETSDVLW